MATEVISTIRASGGDYTTLSAWEAGEQRNLVTADQIEVAECYDDWPSGLDDQVIVDGWTTDATRYIIIRPASGQGHNGTPGTGFRLAKSLTSDFSAVFRNNVGYTRVEKLEVVQSSTSGSFRHAFILNGSNAVASGCLVSSKAGYGFSLSGFAVRAENCLAYACSSAGFNFANNLGKVYNCVSAGNTTGCNSDGSSVVVSNSVAYSNTAGYSGTWSASSTNNASSAASGAPGANAVYSVASSDFANAASNNFHLSSGSVLRGAGTNLYSIFTTDIDGDMRPSSGAWDIGFDYYVAAGGLTITSITASSITQTGARITLGLTR